MPTGAVRKTIVWPSRTAAPPITAGRRITRVPPKLSMAILRNRKNTRSNAISTIAFTMDFQFTAGFARTVAPVVRLRTLVA
jgi:hypothetical protein